jgi:hypothetical protein
LRRETFHKHLQKPRPRVVRIRFRAFNSRCRANDCRRGRQSHSWR